MITQPSNGHISGNGQVGLNEREVASAARELLDSDQDRGSVLLTLDREVLYSNAAARNLLRDGTPRGKDALLPALVDEWLTRFIERARDQRGPASADLYYPNEQDRRMQVTFETLPRPGANKSAIQVVIRVQTARAWNEPTVRRLQSRFGLTLREAQVAAGVARGHTNAEVASRLGIVEKTVKNVLMSVFNKCNVRNRVELALRAYDAPVATLRHKV